MCNDYCGVLLPLFYSINPKLTEFMLTSNINGKTKHDHVEHSLNMTRTRITGYKLV